MKSILDGRHRQRGSKLVACGLALSAILLLSIISPTTSQVTPGTAEAISNNTNSSNNTSNSSNNENSQPPSEENLQTPIPPKRPEQVTVIAPKYLRPQSDYHVLVNLANSQVPATVDLQLIGARDSDREQTEAKSVLANPNETQTIKFQVGDWPSAEYVLNVSVQAIDRSWNFTDEKRIIYQAKSFSAFIQTDKAIYKPGQLVQFRALFLTPTLTPALVKNEINVTVEDPERNTIKQWQYLSNYRGLLSLEMPLSEDPMLGDYTIRMSAKNQEFSKQFSVAEYVLPTYEVSIQLPSYAAYNESDIVATVRASYTYGKPVQGHVTLTVQPLVRFLQLDTRPLNQAQFKARLAPDGSADIQVDLVKDLKLDRVEDSFEREIEFFALVEEDLTGRKYNKTQTLRLYQRNIKIDLLNKDEVFKPGMSQLMQYKVAYQDDIPVEDNGPAVELKYSVRGKQIHLISLRPVGGIIEHRLEVPAKVTSPLQSDYQFVPNQLEIEANYRQQVHYLDPMSAYQSEAHQYIQVNLPQLAQRRGKRPSGTTAGGSAAPTVSIDDDLKVQVRSTEPMQQVTCQGFSRGDIVWALSKQAANKTEFEFDIKVDQRMAPETRILCFYIRPENKELIADSKGVQVVDGRAKNLVKLTPSRDEAKPGQEVEVGVFTKPNSLIGILGVDQSVLLLKSGNDLSSKEIMQDLKSYGSGEGDQGPSLNTEGLFDSANVVVLTNNLVYDGLGSRFGRLLVNPHIYETMAFRAQSGARIAFDSAVLEHQLQPPVFKLNKRQEADPIRIRSLFPETWLWQNATADSSGQVKFSARVPDTITSWQLSAFSMNEAHGLALSSGKTSVRVFRPFFIKLNLPYSIIRGEIVSIQAIVFNYSKRPLAARVTLENKRGEFEFVEAANSIQDEKHSNGTSESRLVQIPANEGASVSFLVKPTKLGHIEIKVLAQSDYLGDGVVRKLLVKAEGQVQHFNKAMLVQLAGPQSTWRRNVTLEVPANAVPDSQKVFVSAIGDILGAGLSNVDDLLRLPYGCGEQNMINLVPNIVIMNYLRNTRRLREPQRERATKNTEVGYQRQLNYARPDGSFSAFGPSDANGSVWLTAYVLKTLQQASSIITVDERVLARAADFLLRHSRQEGSFEEVGMLHHKELASSSATGNERTQSIYLTAYALVALLQRPRAGANPQAAPEQLQEAIDKGLGYLERQLGSEGSGAELTTYELSIIAHTLALAGDKHQEASDGAYKRLWERAIESAKDNHVHWSNSKGVDNKSREPDDASSEAAPDSTEAATLASDGQRSGKLVASTVPPLKPIAVKSDQSAHLFTPNSLDVEMTSWALLTAVKRNELERAMPIVRWLVSQQNSLGGFASTQDTVLAIEALASYAEASALSKVPQSIEVEFIYPRAATTTSQLRKISVDQVLVSQTNALVQQQIRLPDNITWVLVQATGAGPAVVQVSWQYNLLVSAERPAFFLNPILDRSSSINYLQLNICTFYKGDSSQKGEKEPQQQQQQSNMAVVEVELPSGYVADQEALPSLKRHQQIKRVDTLEGETKVQIYLDRVTRDELCFTVPAHRSSKVSNNKPVPVTIYDYYDRKQAARIFYEPPTASSCDICESDTCNEFCSAASSGAAKRSDKLVSLHEQRQQQQQVRDRLQAVRPSNTSAALTEAHNSTRPTNSTAFQVPEAFKLLPLSSAFSKLNEAAQSVHIDH